MPQGKRTTSEVREFKLMLTNINFLYLGLRVFIICDRTYLGRFWTQFEAWLSMQMPSLEGLVSAPLAERRCKIECVHGAPDGLRNALVEEWSLVTAAEAYAKLSSADVTVTNLSDKEIQLPKIAALDETVRTTVAAEGNRWGDDSPLHRGRESWDADGDVSAAMPQDEAGLKRLLLDLKWKIREKDRTISTLRAENTRLKERLGEAPDNQGNGLLRARTVPGGLAGGLAASTPPPAAKPAAWLGEVTSELSHRLSQTVKTLSSFDSASTSA